MMESKYYYVDWNFRDGVNGDSKIVSQLRRARKLADRMSAATGYACVRRPVLDGYDKVYVSRYGKRVCMV